MRAAAIDRFGGPSVLKLHTLPVPKHNAQEVLIAIDTAGVGAWDQRMRSDGEEKALPLVLGTDGSGIIVAFGSGVRRLAVGDRVYSYSYENPKGGFYAEYVAVAASKVARIPDSLDFLHAGAIPTIALTALQGVDDALRIGEGENVIVHGASGNVGMLALQFAKLRGARVLATASGSDGLDLVRRLGADEAVDGKRADIAAAARKFAAGGIDVVLAFAGGKELTPCLDALRRGGRVAYPNGVEPEPKKRRGVKMKAYDAVPGVREFERLARAIEESALQIPIACEFALADAADAHRRLQKGHLVGKVVLRVQAGL
jgi:NADPH:quinone reductase